MSSPTTNSHTEGPWVVVGDDDCPDDQASLVIQQSTGHAAIIARLDRRNDSHAGYIRRNRNDAQLIASAPVMINALERIYDHISSMEPGTILCGKDRAGIMETAWEAISEAKSLSPQP
jgi:hypothetical protein